MRGTEQKTTLELKLEKLRLICERSPDNAIGLLALAETAFRRGLRLEALEAYQKVLKDESVAEAHLCMAQMYRHHGLYQEAISELRVLFEMEPGYPEAHVFARQLAGDTTLPGDIEEILLAGCGNDELALARVRLSIARSLVLREGQELVAIQDANAGDPTFGYYICETRKRLTYCEEVLSQLAVLEDARKAYLADLDRQRQIERERQRAAESQGDGGSHEGVAITAALVEPLQGGPEYVDPAAGQFDDFPTTVEHPGDLVAVAYPEPGDEGREVYPDQDPEEVHQDPEEVYQDQDPEEVQQDPQEVYQEPGEVGLDFHASVVSEELPVEPDPGGYAPEPALWDDHPTYVAPTPTHDSGEGIPRDHQRDLTLDLTPTLEGSLPDGPTEVAPGPGALWDDEPGYEAPPVVGLNLNYESGLGDDLGGPEVVETIPVHLELQPPLQPEPPAVYEPEPEPTPMVEEPDFAGLYAPLLGGLDGLIQTLAKTRSVSSVFLLNREGYTIAEQVKDSIGRERLSEFIIETVSFLEAFASAPQYWVLECAGGIVVIQSVDSYHYLITIGQTGANFGALRYTMDRVRPNFEQVLQPACPV